jgi:predicted porin
LGTINVGQTDTPLSSTFTLTLANINHVEADPTSMGVGFFLRGTDGSLIDATWEDLANPSQFSVSRRNVVRYDSPTFGGLQFQAAWGESDIWAVSLAYAGEFSGFRLAAKIAYGEVSDPNLDCESTGGSPTTHTESDCQLWSVGASIMHVPTGLFLTGNYGEHNDDLRGPGVDASDTAWYVHGGIEQKFNQLGKTTLYGEYGEQENGFAAAPYGGTTMSFWGVGLVQSIDAAAMDMYVFYRNYSSEIPVTFADPVEDLTMIGAGAMIKF